MSPSAESRTALLKAVETELVALEAALAQTQAALAEGNEEAVDAGVADQRRLQHALENAMHDAREVRTREFDKVVFGRLSQIGIARDRQIAALQSQRDDISAKLTQLTHWKRAARKWLSGFDARKSGGIDQRR